MEKVLVRNGRHQSPMLAVLERNRIGNLDTYGRGRWITEKDLPNILEGIKKGPLAIKTGESDVDWCCSGTNMHNSVYYSEFKALFD